MRRRVKRRQFDAGGDQTSCRRSRDAAKNMYTTRRATIGHFLHHSGHGPCDDGPSIRPASSYRVKSSKRVLSSGDYFYFCNRKNKLVGGRIHILWIDYDPKSILKYWSLWIYPERVQPGPGFQLFQRVGNPMFASYLGHLPTYLLFLVDFLRKTNLPT